MVCQRLDKYTLIITEKPDAAARIANALDESGEARKSFDGGVPYFSAKRDNDLVVVPALGHLYTVAGKTKSRDYPVFDFQWVPRYFSERGASRIRIWLKVIAKLAENAEAFIDACDFDLEGSIIGYCILKFACGGKEQIAKRMKYSTLTSDELQESYDNLLPNIDFALVESGLTRHEVDWLYGINLSRALTMAANNFTGMYATISTGRVQGPTLKFLETREKTIKCFVPTPFWSLTADIAINGFSFEVKYEKNITSKIEAEKIKNDCKAREGTIQQLSTKNFLLNPPFPFDLGTLQSEAYRLFKYTPARTLSIAQHLYLSALISYPRTSSQKLPSTIDYEKILKKLSKNPVYAKETGELLTKKFLKPNEGQKVDPAHPAIYPTGNLPNKSLDKGEENILDLVVRRFLAVFGEPAIRQSIKAIISITENYFLLNRIQTIDEGWMRLYKPFIQFKDTALPLVNKGQKITVKRIKLLENFTKPPPRYNPSSLLKKMEKEEIGTKATRAGIIKTLYDRNYIQGTEGMLVTDLGFEVTEVLRKYCPTVMSIELTRQLEEKMEQIRQRKESRQSILQNVIEALKPVTTKLKEKETAIGEQLSEAIKKSKLQEKTIGLCPVCNRGKLVILRSKKTGKRFIGCTDYFEGKCKTSFPLPQKGVLKLQGNACKSCSSPTIRVGVKGRRAWTLCINPNCPSKGVHKK